MIALVVDLHPSALSIALFAAGWSAGWFLLARPRRLPLAPVGRRGRSPITVVVPARNEERSLPTLLASVVAQLQPDDTLIVVDDHSTDATAALARAGGAHVIPAPELPAGWAGKPHACYMGAALAARACARAANPDDVLVFLDADVRLGPDVLDALAAEVERDRDALVSVQPWHTPGRAAEQLSLLPNLLALMGAAAFTPLGPGRAARVAFGPVLACRRGTYDGVGGHAHPEVRATILEDIALARRFPSTQLFVGQPDRITFRMYPGGTRDIIEGWTKGLGIGIDATPWWALVAAVGWVTSLAGGWLTSPWFAAASIAQLAFLARRAGRFSAAAIVTYPIGVLFLVLVALRSIGRRRRSRRGHTTVSWKGRDLRPDQPTS